MEALYEVPAVKQFWDYMVAPTFAGTCCVAPFYGRITQRAHSRRRTTRPHPRADPRVAEKAHPMYPPLYLAAENDHHGIAETLLKWNANVNQVCTDDGTTPLWIAAQEGHVSVTETLLYFKANVNQASTDDGQTPLCVAAECGHTRVAEALLKAKADVNQAMTDGSTPLKKATEKGHTAIVDLLKQHGAV